MYISPKKKRLYIILGVIFALMVPISVVAFYLYRDWRSRASATAKPEDVRISDLTPGSVVISWITPDKDTEGWIQYGTAADVGDGSPLVQDDRDVESGTSEKRTTHYVTIKNLDPDTKYYYVIGSGSEKYKDTDGNPFEFTTSAVDLSGQTPTPDPAYGTVTNGEDEGAIVYITLSNGSDKSFPVSTYTNDSGDFEIDLTRTRTAALDDLFDYDDSTELTVFAQGGDKGGAVLNVSVADKERMSLTMDEDYTVTDVFADSSSVDVGDSDSGDQDDQQEEEEEEEEPEEEPPVKSKKKDVPLDALVLGISSTSSGISNIQVTNVTENSFTVVWESLKKETGYVTYGATLDLAEAANDDRDGLTERGSYYMHHVSVTDLIPETMYYYEIHSGDIPYDDNGDPYEITTPSTEDSPPAYDSLLGEVTGSGKSDAVIVAIVQTEDGESSAVSTVADNSGNWTLSIGSVRNDDYDGYFNYGSDDTVVITGLTKGDEYSGEYTIGDVGDDVISIELEMVEPVEGDDDEFDRGIYDALASLPVTAVNRIVAVGITVSVVMIAYGTYLLSRVYSSERKQRWESDVLKKLDL